ncbi:restriction endonuclease subunit S [Guptibacillus hwajinpoensis]|uniref:Restriction endonuclease S subunit n=1 Tax=Guptibacillus hwajinpoensis TaxID=208199 RepID=A0ABU0JWR2_9BACL|nr:restriction endonuclease subunit S [Alkalihalobacillus hemicentroti]MDQ0481534.1 restriction endonuclease S subunit [Alkalihalobacillus hemicentroti]
MKDYKLKKEITERNKKWKIVALKRLLITPITDGPHETPTLLDEGIPFLSAESVKDGVINFNKKRGYISAYDHKRFSKKCLPQKNDIFVVKSGATTGKVAFVNTDKEFSIWSPLALIRADKEKVDPYYLYYFISSPAFFTQVETGWNYGTQQNIGMKVMENLLIAVPPLKDQKTIYNFLDQKVTEIDSLIAEKEKLINKLKEYRQSLIYEAVTGKIDVQDMIDEMEKEEV